MASDAGRGDVCRSYKSPSPRPRHIETYRLHNYFFFCWLCRRPRPSRRSTTKKKYNKEAGMFILLLLLPLSFTVAMLHKTKANKKQRTSRGCTKKLTCVLCVLLAPCRTPSGCNIGSALCLELECCWISQTVRLSADWNKCVHLSRGSSVVSTHGGLFVEHDWTPRFAPPSFLSKLVLDA